MFERDEHLYHGGVLWFYKREKKLEGLHISSPDFYSNESKTEEYISRSVRLL